MLMRQFETLGYATVGSGPDHQHNPQPEKKKEIEQFIEQHDFLRQAPDYVTFLFCYAAAAVYWPGGELTIEIYGFDENITAHLVLDQGFLGPIIDTEGFFLFCGSRIWPVGEDPIYIDYAFDATGQRRWGVYRKITGQYEWYCETFLDWLQVLIEKKGRLL